MQSLVYDRRSYTSYGLAAAAKRRHWNGSAIDFRARKWVFLDDVFEVFTPRRFQNLNVRANDIAIS